jgi:hypothetical protein
MDIQRRKLKPPWLKTMISNSDEDISNLVGLTIRIAAAATTPDDIRFPLRYAALDPQSCAIRYNNE